MRKDNDVRNLVFDDSFAKYFELLSSDTELNKVTSFKIAPYDQKVNDEDDAKAVLFERKRLNALLNLNMFGCRLVVAMFVDRTNPEDVVSSTFYFHFFVLKLNNMYLYLKISFTYPKNSTSRRKV